MTAKVSGLTVMVIYPHLPHYRYGVFRELANSRNRYEFVADQTSRDGSIPTVPPEMVENYTPVRNLWIGPLLWQRRVVAKIVRRRPAAVIFLAHGSYMSTWVGALVARALGIKVLFWTIGWHRPETGVRRLFRLTFYRLADRLLLYGETGRDIGVAMGFPRDRLSVIRNSAESSERVADVAEHELERFIKLLPDGRRPVLTAVIRLNQVKRLDLLILAASQLCERGRPVDVLLVGDGPDAPSLAELAVQHGVSLHMPGMAYSQLQLARVYSVTTMTVVPRAAGLTVIQSLAFGRPVVTTDDAYTQMPEFEAIVPGVTGDLFTGDDPTDLADVILDWIRRCEWSADTIAEECRNVVEEAWSPSAHAQAIDEQVDLIVRSAS